MIYAIKIFNQITESNIYGIKWPFSLIYKYLTKMSH